MRANIVSTKGSVWKLITETEDRGSLKTTNAMQCGNDVVIQVSTRQRNPDYTYVIAEALTTIHNMLIVDVVDSLGNVIGRELRPIKLTHKF